MKSIEQNIFTWEQFSEEGVMSCQFYDVELVVPVGEFPVGTKFTGAYIGGENSVLVLYDETDTPHAFRLNLTAGEPVDLKVLQGTCTDASCTQQH
jgi:hypothetical protein